MLQAHRAWKAVFIVLGLLLCIGPRWAAAYDSYEPTIANDGCYQCHTGFKNRGPLHTLHVGSSAMTSTCTYCHRSTGDNPTTYTSGTDPNHACNGCHVGPGLRRHHANAGAPADGAGRTCASCHTNDPTPTAENIAPPYYGRTGIKLTSPCVVAKASGGEDYNGDGHGLDNDGDLLYDGADNDCNRVPVSERTWGVLKGLFRN